MGGFLAQPTKFYLSIFPEDGIFGTYPYLLPNLVAMVAILLAVAQGVLFLEETNPLFTETPAHRWCRRSTKSMRPPLSFALVNYSGTCAETFREAIPNSIFPR